SAHPRSPSYGGDAAGLRCRLSRRSYESLGRVCHPRRVHRSRCRMGRLRLCGRRSAPALFAELRRDRARGRHVRSRRAPLRRSVSLLVNRFGQAGLAQFGGVLLGLAYLTLAVGGSAWLAPVAVTAIGLGFYALHNTMQTNAAQMTPQARGTAVAIFSSAIYLGQTLGVAAGAVVFDRSTAVPLFVGTAVALPALAFWFAAKLRRHTTADRERTSPEVRG